MFVHSPMHHSEKMLKRHARAVHKWCEAISNFYDLK